MKKIKVYEASGPVLDWLVELALGTHWSPNGYFVHKFPDGKTETFSRHPKHPYSTSWTHGGPILEAQKFDICFGSFHRLLIVRDIGTPDKPIADKHDLIADLGETSFPYNATEDSTRRYDNAKRLVACWNACDGISTENLEQNLPVKELATKYNDVLRQRDELLAEVARLQALINAPHTDGWMEGSGKG